MKRLSGLMKVLRKKILLLKTYQTGSETENPGKMTRDMVKVPRDDEEEDRHFYDFNRLSQLPPKLKILKFFSKTPKKTIKARFMSDFSETFPMDVLGAAQSEGAPAIICISSDKDEEMGSFDGDSVDDVYVSSEEEMLDIEIMARCIERQMAEPIAILNAETTGTQARCGTRKPDLPPFPTFTQQFFNLGMGNGPIGRDDRIRPNHPINICRDLRPNIDTPMSPPPEDRGPACEQDIPSCSYSTSSTSVETVANHFNDMTVSVNAGLLGCSDCVIRGKPVQQVQDEAVNDILNKTVAPGETLAETERRRKAFLDGMAAGTFLLMPGECRRRPPAMATGTRSHMAIAGPYLEQFH